MFFAGLDWGYRFWEEAHRGEVSFASHHIEDISSAWLTTWCWPWSPGRGNICQICLLSPPRSTLFSWEGSHYTQPTLQTQLNQAGPVFFPLLGIRNWDLKMLVSLLGLLELGVTRGWWPSPALFMEKQGMVWRERITNAMENGDGGTQPERGEEGADLPCLWSFQYLLPLLWETQLQFLLWGLVRYPHMPAITSTSRFSKEIICTAFGNISNVT